MSNSHDELLSKAAVLVEGQSIGFKEAMQYSIKYAMDPDINELINYITNKKNQHTTKTRT